MKHLRLVLALLVAALWSDVLDRATWRKAGKAFKALFGLLEASEKVSAELYERRMAACRACPLFFSRLETCGSPLSKELRSVGCWCYLPCKNEQRGSTCWGDDAGGYDFKWGWRASGIEEEKGINSAGAT